MSGRILLCTTLVLWFFIADQDISNAARITTKAPGQKKPALTGASQASGKEVRTENGKLVTLECPSRHSIIITEAKYTGKSLVGKVGNSCKDTDVLTQTQASCGDLSICEFKANDLSKSSNCKSRSLKINFHCSAEETPLYTLYSKSRG